MSNKWLVLVMTLILLLMTMPMLVACSDDGDEEDKTETIQPTETVTPTETGEPTEPSGDCTKEEDFKIGLVGTVMGMTADSRDPTEEIAMDEINEAGGIRIGDTCVKFKYHHEDDKGTSAGAVSAIQKLLYEFNADLVLSTAGIVPSPLSRPYTEEEKTIFFATHTPIEEWLGPEYPYTFYLHFISTADPIILLDWVSKNRPDIKKVHGVRQLSTIYEYQTPIVEKAATAEFGIEYTGTDWYEMTVRDFYPVLTAALQNDPDALIVDTYSLTLLAKQARELGFEGTFIVPGSIPDYAYKMMTPEEINGIICLSPSVESPLVPQYYKDYKESYYERKGGYPYSMTTFPLYLQPYYIAAAIKAAGSTDTEKIKEVMETQTLTLEFPNGETLDIKMSGAEQFGVNHAWTLPKYLSVIKDGKPDVLEVITPEKLDYYLDIYRKYD